MSVELWEIILAVALSALGFGLAWAARKGATDEEFNERVLASGHRASDKYLEEMKRARLPDSPGGVEATADEKSQARQKAYDVLMQEMPAHLIGLAKRKGPEIIKGLIGRVMEKAEREKSAFGTIVTGTVEAS